jgi:anti-anti-sigma factor
MKTTVHSSGKTLLLEVEGHVTGATIVQVQRLIESQLESAGDRVVVDVHKVPQVDTSAVGGLIYSGKLLQKGGKKLVLVAPQRDVKRSLRGLGASGAFDVVDTFNVPSPQRVPVPPKGR